MADYKCKYCGANLEYIEGKSTIKCLYCDSWNTISTTSDADLQNMFSRADSLRSFCEFDKGEKSYEHILEMAPTDAEAYWGLLLCKYGIEYVLDPETNKRVPTCHRASYDSILLDEDYKNVLKYAQGDVKAVYQAQANEIERIQKEIVTKSLKEDNYDVFICYKEKDQNGLRTPDSVIANDIYYQLTQKGYKVFYAAISLEDKLGQDYEPIIFAALNSAKVMLVFGTRPEYFKAVWVKNEWSRFLKLIKKDRTKRLFPCYKDMDPYDLPEDFAHLQAQDMGKIGFITDLVRGVEKIVPKAAKNASTISQQSPAIRASSTNYDSSITPVAPLLKRAFLFLEDKDSHSAEEYFEKVLDRDPENSTAYFGKLMLDYNVFERNQLGSLPKSFEENSNYKKAYRFGDDALKAELNGYLTQISNREKAAVYDKALRMLETAKTRYVLEAAMSKFSELGDWKDAHEKVKECNKKLEELGDSKLPLTKNLRLSKPKLIVVLTVLVVAIIVAGLYLYNFFMYTRYTFTLSYIEDGYSVSVGKNDIKIARIPKKYKGEPVTSVDYNGFDGCVSLTSVILPDTITSIYAGAFSGCSNLKSVTLSSNLISIGEEAFYECDKLKKISIPDSVSNIGKWAFAECASLESVTLGSCLTKISPFTFYNCCNLLSITIPEGVSDIMGSAFLSCTGLSSITIPHSVTIIDEYAFGSCYSLSSITYQGKIAEWNLISKGDHWHSNTGVFTIHCLDGDIVL